MSSSIIIKRVSTNDVVNILVTSIIKHQRVSQNYLAKRFGVESRSLKSIVLRHDSVSQSLQKVLFETDDGVKYWTLAGGEAYKVLAGNNLVEISMVLTADKGKKLFEITDLSDSSQDIVDTTLSRKLSSEKDPEASHVNSSCVTPETIDKPEARRGAIYRISALDILLGVKRHSEIARFVTDYNFEALQVDSLPLEYDGNIVFEVPPIKATGNKGDHFVDIDRSRDCYLWSRITITSANVSLKTTYDFEKVKCTGSFQCRNDKCSLFSSVKERNASSWTGKWKVSIEHQVGGLIPEGGVICGYCKEPPFCVSRCDAKMFYMVPTAHFSAERVQHMSRLAIHVGHHNHPPRKIISREAVKKAHSVIVKQYAANPLATPSNIQNEATGFLLSHLNQESIETMSEDEESELWASLMVISTTQRFLALLRSVRMDSPTKRTFDSLQQLRRSLYFPCLHRYLVPGQGSRDERPHVFKMSTRGYGCGLDLLRRMKPRGSLHGSWVMFDVMHRINKGWLTFSAHVYDHNYLALYTIFTCELMSEDTKSLETAWRKMLEVASENGLPEVTIHGFMANNAQAGWISVRNVFFEGIPHPERERSDAFHFYQSLHPHTKEGIVEGKRHEHLVLWEKLRNVGSYLAAYRISNEILTWWKSGNCVAGELKMMQGWLSWWVVR